MCVTDCDGYPQTAVEEIPALDPGAEACEDCSPYTTALGRFVVLEEPTMCEAGTRYQPLNCLNGNQGDGSCPWACPECVTDLGTGAMQCDIGGHERPIAATDPDNCLCDDSCPDPEPLACVPRVWNWTSEWEESRAPTMCRAGQEMRTWTCRQGQENEGGCVWDCPRGASGTDYQDGAPATDPDNCSCDDSCEDPGGTDGGTTGGTDGGTTTGGSDSGGTTDGGTTTGGSDSGGTTDGGTTTGGSDSGGTTDGGTTTGGSDSGGTADGGTTTGGASDGGTSDGGSGDSGSGSSGSSGGSGGTEGGEGHCTAQGNHYPGDEVYCSPIGRVLTNGRCEQRACPANSTDNGSGVCVCDPGYVYDNSQPGNHGRTYFYPRTCTARSPTLCGAVADPGTCGSGGTWNSGTATCGCGDGYERSDDGQSCVCAPDDTQSLGHQPSVLHPNPQSLFDGLQVGFVNTTTSNLTFRRRDMVTRAQGPVVFARVYDSRIGANDDFGPGWRLSLAEELHVDRDVVTYIGASGARQTFAWNGTGYAASPSTPRHAGTALAFADIDGLRVATLRDGDTMRTFAQVDEAGTRYVVRTVRATSRELMFDYGQGRLATVSHDGATLFAIDRDAAGRIVEVRDNHGRSVRYTYDFDRRLATVRDIAGSDWSYRYRGGGRLGTANDPEGRTYLAATYGDDGRVAQSFSGRLYSYAYPDATTTVTEDDGEVHTFARNAAGVTTSLSSTGGVSWRLTLDAANRVASLAVPERTSSYTYDSGGRVATETVADAVAGATSMRSYTYDAQGRLTDIAGSGRDVYVTHAEGHVHIVDGDEVFEYHLDRKGRVTSVRQGTDKTIRAERDDAGDIVAISDGYRTVRFNRDALGRIAEATLGDGDSARYFYDELGNRRLSEYGPGRSVAYAYDAAGSMVGIETTRHDGSVHRPTVTLATAEPIEGMAYDGSLTLSVDYGTRDYGPLGAVREEVTTGPRDAENLVAAGYGDREPPSSELRVPTLTDALNRCPSQRLCSPCLRRAAIPMTSATTRASPTRDRVTSSSTRIWGQHALESLRRHWFSAAPRRRPTIRPCIVSAGPLTGRRR